MGINSRLKVLGRANKVFVNINRTKISDDQQPQLDLVGEKSLLSFGNFENPFKKIKDKLFNERDN